MTKIRALCLLSLALAGCSSFPIHKLEIEQGNVMNTQEINRLHPGMSEGQVRAILGKPVLRNLLNNDDLCYVYTYQIGTEPRVDKRLILTFHRGVLEDIQREGV